MQIRESSVSVNPKRTQSNHRDREFEQLILCLDKRETHMRKHIHFVRLYAYLVRAEIPTTSGLEVATTPTSNNTITAENTQTHF